MVDSWNSWNCPLTNRRTSEDFPTADSPSSTSLNWDIREVDPGAAPPDGRLAEDILMWTLADTYRLAEKLERWPIGPRSSWEELMWENL